MPTKHADIDRRLVISALGEWLAGLLLLALGAMLLMVTLNPGAGLLVPAVGVYLLMSAAAWRWLPLHHPQQHFGPANRITLLRLVLTALAAGALAAPVLLHEHGWLLVGLTLTALLLDGVDGWLARHHECASAFGARFDMETDALLILILALLVWQRGQVGFWIVLAGIWRYLFLVGAMAWPWLRAPLPPSRRRQTVCVIQIVVLIVCLGPPIEPTMARFVAALSLLLLSASFIIDIFWLYRHRRTS